MNCKKLSKNKVDTPAHDLSWEQAIKKGRTQRGNLQVNLDFIKQTGLACNGKTALELGCGAGNLASFLQAQGISVIASDISQAAIDHARKLHPDVEFHTHSADELPYKDNAFDLVMSFDVLEHLPNVDQHLGEVHRVLKDRGYYLFQTPNKLTNATFETLKRRSMKWKKFHPSLHFYGQLRRRLKQNYFSPTFIKMNTMNEFIIKKIQGAGLPGWIFRWINFRYLPFRMQSNFFVVAQKKNPRKNRPC
jgi:2-polyprenyl-3-methyl-5-hydroxy-6-metoxy-1,4-benzoquinol methylase